MRAIFIITVAVAGLGILAGVSEGGSRTSASYTVSADAMDAGGGRGSSVKYTNDADIGALGAVTSPSETGKGGYIGQLYDVTSLAVTAATTNVSAGSNLQLSASALLDDTTSFGVPATQVSWSVVSGPIAGINASGLATAGSVSVNTTATVQGKALGQSGTLQLLVMVVSGGQSMPTIASAMVSGGNFIFSGTNGTPGKNYYVLTTTNVGLPLSNWTVLETNTFDGSGNFRVTNSMTGLNRFYLLKA